MTGAAIAILLLAGAGEAPAPGDALLWQRVREGVEHLHVDAVDGEALRFDLGRFVVDVAAPGAAAPLTAAELLRQRGAVLAVNGGFFDSEGRSLGLRIARGRTVLGLRPRVDWGVLVVRGAHAAIVHSRDWSPAPDVTAAIQVGPRVLVAGEIPGLKPQFSRRTAVGVDRGGGHLIVVVTRARASAAAMGDLLARLGCQDGLLLDGGPSTQLAAAIGDLTLEVVGGYRVPDLLVVTPRAP
jgi:uncharacterized protein YigE (DUF2233 family)